MAQKCVSPRKQAVLQSNDTETEVTMLSASAKDRASACCVNFSQHSASSITEKGFNKLEFQSHDNNLVITEVQILKLHYPTNIWNVRQMDGLPASSR